MKKHFLLSCSLALLLSCSKEDVDIANNQQLNSSSINSSNLRQGNNNPKIVLSEDYPSDLSEFNTQDFSDIALNNSKKKLPKVKNIPGATLDEIIENVYKKYPNIDKFDPQSYKKLFPKLSTDDIINNREIIFDLTEKMMAFDVSSAFSQLKNAKYSISDKKNKSARGYISSGTWLNEVCTVAVIIAHLRLDIVGLRQSVNYANNLSEEYGKPTTMAGAGDRQDALRHGLWGIFIGMYGTWRYSDPAKAERIIRELLFAHECGEGNSLSSNMDFHNNNVALKYYRDNVIVFGTWLDKRTMIRHSPEFVAYIISKYPVDLVSTIAEINQRNDITLVRYQ